MDQSTLSREARWLRERRGTETQERLAQDISDVTGWRIPRDRYSKYESGSLPMGRKVLGHFIAYWKSRGQLGPEALPEPAAEPTLAAALSELAAELRESRQERKTLEARIRAVEAELLSHRVQPGGAGSQAQSPPQETAG